MTLKQFLGAAVLMALSTLSFDAHTAPFQFQSFFLFGQSDRKTTNRTIDDGDVQAIGVSYFLKPVESTSGPLVERAFIDKSSFITGTVTRTKPSFGRDSDVINIAGSYVTQESLIISGGYTKFDSSGAKTLSVGLGKYLDDRTTAGISFQSTDTANDTERLSASFRRLIEGSSPETHIAYLLGLGYLDAVSGSGITLELGGSYYFSDALSLSAQYDYIDAGSSEEKRLGIIGRYYFTDTLAGALAYTQQDFSFDTESKIITASIGARF